MYSGSERAEAQTFLNELFACYGTDRSAVAQFEEAQGGRFLDLIWPRVCIFEMKRPSEARRLDQHRKQALRYWSDAADAKRGIPSPRWVVLCAFQTLEIWEPGLFPKEPRATLSLVELPDHYDALIFLAGREPVFVGDESSVTREAVSKVASLYRQLVDRRAAAPDVLRDFALQAVWCMFAEDLGQIQDHAFTRVVDDLLAQPHRSSADDVGGMFEVLNTSGPRPKHGLYAGVPYADGGLFERPARVHLDVDELRILRDACAFQWGRVEPSIFGTLLEGGLGHDQQWLLGAHYTHEADIQKVVQPSIVEPWTERIANVETLGQAEAALDELLRFVVLDPACGSGNFLYVAYRELRRLERELHERVSELRQASGLSPQTTLTAFFPLENIRGIEIDRFAARLARVTLWMAHKLAVDELELSEATLPLSTLPGIRAGDALRLPWPRANVIIGNPPFHGTKSMRSALGDPYVDWLREAFGVGVKDYCVYWFRRAQDALAAGDRAGLVATNSIAEGKNREASLEYIVKTGGQIMNAVREQPWPGEAMVYVSIVNWGKTPSEPVTPAMLDGVEVPGITSQLRAGAAEAVPEPLKQNAGRQFFGIVQSGEGFVLDPAEARSLLARADANYAAVVKPFLVGNDIAKSPAIAPTRWIVDFAELPLEQAEEWPAAMKIVRERVKPLRDKHKKARERHQWWKFSRTVPDLFDAVSCLRRFIACPATAKRYFMIWCEPNWCPSNATSVFALQDDYAFGVLSSTIHTGWARRVSTALETRPRYTVASFATFPWPDPSVHQRAEIGRLGRDLDSGRRAICAERGIGLGTLQNTIDEGAWPDIRAIQMSLDECVADAYGWPPTAALNPELRYAELLELNRAIVAGEVPYPVCLTLVTCKCRNSVAPAAVVARSCT